MSLLLKRNPLGPPGRWRTDQPNINAESGSPGVRVRRVERQAVRVANRRSLVALAWDQQHLDRTQRILQAWRTRDLVAGTTQVAALRQAIAGADWDTVQRHDDIEAAMAFDGVLPPESLSFAGQAAISRPLACQSTPEPVPGPISLSGTAGPAACGETGMVSSSSGRNSVRANRPDTARKSQRNPFFSGGHNGGRTSSEKP